MLMERDEETARLTRFLSAGAGAQGRIGVIGGAVGAGKTALLNTVSERLTSRGARLLTAVASPSEQAYPYAVLEQLLQGLPPADEYLPPLAPAPPAAAPPVHTGPPPARPGSIAADTRPPTTVPLPVLRRFHQRLITLTSREPVLVAIDDVQFADDESLTCLAYAARRLPGDVFSVLVTRSSRTAPMPTVLKELLHQSHVCNVQLAPLSVAGVEGLLAESLDTADAARLAPGFHASTGGNPLLVQGFLDDAPTLTPSGGGDVLPRAGEMFRQAALACVHRSGRESLLVAQGIALLGSAESVPLLRRLVSLEDLTVRRCVASLGEAGVLDGPRFRHEAAQGAVLEGLPTQTAAELRARAARLLHEDGAPAIEIAHQLIGHEGAAPREEWVPGVLREAARQALAEDRITFVTRCLQTAERCCADEQERLSIRADLAQIIWRVKPSAAVQQLQSLAEPAKDGLLSPSQTVRLAMGLLWNGQLDDAAAAIRQVGESMSSTPDPRVDTELRAVHLMLAATCPDVLDTLKQTPRPAAGTGPSGAPVAETPPLRVFGALRAALRQDPVESSAAEAEQVLRTTRLSDMTVHQIRAALLALVYADRLGQATSWCDRFLAEAEERVAPGWLLTFNAVRGEIALRRGHLVQAVELTERALEQLPAHGWGVGIGMPLSILVAARTAMGHHDVAAELLETPVPESMFHTRYGMHYLYARGLHQLATGRHHAALTDFLTCGERMAAWEMDSASLVPWRLGAAETWLALDERANAADLAREQLARCGPGQAQARGGALRILAATRPPTERPELLGRALAASQTGGDSYETARTLADLGQAHKQLGDVTKGRLLTRRAWRMAEACGAEELCRTLQPAPVRAPAPEAPAEGQGTVPADNAAVASLTSAERRVASLAVYGYTNREIAAKLFITVSTVEQHLTRVYRKINISHRQDLPVSLDSDVAHSA